MDLTRALMIVSILVWIVPAKAFVDQDWRAFAVGTCVTVVFWVVTALRLRSNLNERGGYLNDR